MLAQSLSNAENRESPAWLRYDLYLMKILEFYDACTIFHIPHAAHASLITADHQPELFVVQCATQREQMANLTALIHHTSYLNSVGTFHCGISWYRPCGEGVGGGNEALLLLVEGYGGDPILGNMHPFILERVHTLPHAGIPNFDHLFRSCQRGITKNSNLIC